MLTQVICDQSLFYQRFFKKVPFIVLDKLPAEHGQADEAEVSSAVVSSVLDSGVCSHGFIENREREGDSNTAPDTQVIENCQRIETSV